MHACIVLNTELVIVSFNDRSYSSLKNKAVWGYLQSTSMLFLEIIAYTVSTVCSCKESPMKLTNARILPISKVVLAEENKIYCM